MPPNVLEDGVMQLHGGNSTEIAEKYEEAEPVSYPISFIPLQWPELILAIMATGAVITLTRGRIFLWMGPLFKNLGKGKSGGGGAGGKIR